MNPTEYQTVAARTASSMNSPTAKLTFALGLAGEVIELHRTFHEEAYPAAARSTRVIDELGDCLWYSAMLCNEFELSLDQLLVERADEDTRPIGRIFDELLWNTGRVTEYLKKVISHGHPLRAHDLSERLSAVLTDLSAVAVYHQQSPGTVMELNAAKLGRRYPDGFHSRRSVERDE